MLGFDTARSTDHDCGPQLLLFLSAGDVAQHAGHIQRLLAQRLPFRLHGWPTGFRDSLDPADPVGCPDGTVAGRLNHRFGVVDTTGWLADRLGVDAAHVDPDVDDWLVMPQQRLAEVTGGVVFREQPAAWPPRDAGWPSVPSRCGGTCWPAGGGASNRRRRSSVAAPRLATSSARPCSPAGWCVT